MKGLRDSFRDMSASTEAASERDGALSYHAETHAAGVGLGLAWLAIVTGTPQLLGLIIPAVTAGLRAQDREFSKILTDIRQEPHYALAGLVLGGLLGVAVRFVLSSTA
jgi:hypothetical protein